jgi:hypothetical protein
VRATLAIWRRRAWAGERSGHVTIESLSGLFSRRSGNLTLGQQTDPVPGKAMTSVA